MLARTVRRRSRRLGLAWRRHRALRRATVVRVDPLPDLQPLPQARYAFLIGAVPRRFGGRTASILTKARLLKELGGVNSTIVTLNHTPALPAIRADLRRRGLLVDGVEIVNLYDFLRGGSRSRTVVRHPVDEPGMETVRDPDPRIFRFVEGGVCRLLKRYDAAGRLVVREWFDEQGATTKLDEFGVDGMLRRTTTMDPQHHQPQHQVFYRSDGSPYLEKRLAPGPTGDDATVAEVTLLDAEGRPTQVLADDVALAHHFFDRLFGEDRVFLTVESRRSDRELLGYRRPNVKRIGLLHNLHLVPPGEHPFQVRRSYRPLFRHRDDLAALVFLTNAQRADAEARFGRRPNFWVVPHPAAPVQPGPFEQRDPHLVVMLARLELQKQLDHAIEAFALVVEAVPEARLEIHGEGRERARLQRLVDERGLTASVTMPGYTKDAPAVYARAALSILTSRNEGYPLTLLETLAHGCPVVSYDVKYGPSEIIADGRNGFLVPRGDVEAVARRVVEVLTDPDLRRRLTEGAGTPGPEFSERTFVARWSRVFRELDAQGWGGTA